MTHIEAMKKIDALRRKYRGKNLPGNTRRMVIKLHNKHFPGIHLKYFGNCMNVAGATCLKCNLTMSSTYRTGSGGDCTETTEASRNDCLGE